VQVAGADQVAGDVGALSDIKARLDAIAASRQKPAGNIRITSSRHATESILMPAVTKLMADYPIGSKLVLTVRRGTTASTIAATTSRPTVQAAARS